MTCFLHWQEKILSKPSCHQPEQQSLGRQQESWRQADIFWLNLRVCAACDGLGLHCVFVERDDSTLLMRVLNWILHTTLAVSFPVLLTSALDCCPVDSSNKTACQHTQLMPRWTGSESTAQILLPKTSSLQIQPTWTPLITTSRGNGGSLSQASPKIENDRRTEGSPAGDLGQPASGTIRQSCQRVLKVTEGLCCSWGWTFWTFNSTVTAMSWLCYFCLNDAI